MDFVGASSDDNYRIIRKIGEGTFGTVFKAIDVKHGRHVALKKMKLKKFQEGLPKDVIRELEALRLLKAAQLDSYHDTHIIDLLEVFTSKGSIIFVYECMAIDLHRILSRLVKPFWPSQIKSMMQMLLQAVDECHRLDIVHRDVKPSNLLFNNEGRLKLADFGLARRVSSKMKENPDLRPMSLEIATRWYKAPEVLLGSHSYDHSVDMWAVGCIFAELIDGSPFFPGNNDIDQLFKIIKVMGTPTASSWPAIESLPDFNKVCLPQVDPMGLTKALPDASPSQVGLLKEMLHFDPGKRITAHQALKHGYFTDEPAPCREEDLEMLVRGGGEGGIAGFDAEYEDERCYSQV